MTLNYRMTMERYLNVNIGASGLILDYEVFSLIDMITKNSLTAR